MANRKGLKDQFLETVKEWCEEHDYTLELEEGKYEDIVHAKNENGTVLKLEKYPSSWSVETNSDSSSVRPPLFYKKEDNLMFKGKRPRNASVWRKVTITDELEIEEEHNPTKDPRRWS